MRKEKLLLIAPPLKNGSPFNPHYIPLRLAYIASMVRRERFDVRISDMNASLSINEMLDSLKKFQPDVVCINCFADNYLFACNLAKMAKNFGCFIVLSGLHVTFIAEEVLKENSEVDAVVRGEEEDVLVEIMEAKAGYKGLEEILGITYRGEDNRVYSNPERLLIQNLDTLPFPARDLLPRYEYIPLLASRGCSFNCIYCPFSAFWRHTLRVRSPENAVDEIESIYQKYGSTHFEFLDSLFPFSDWGEKLFQMMRSISFDIKWRCSTRVDFVREESLEMAAEVGCEKITFGVEACSDNVLRNINKTIKLRQVKNAVRWAKKNGIETKLNFILGLPGQYKEDAIACLKLVEELRPEEVKFGILTPYPGTEVVKNIKKYGVTFKKKNWWKYNSTAPQTHTQKLSSEEISSLFFMVRDKLKGLGIPQVEHY